MAVLGDVRNLLSGITRSFIGTAWSLDATGQIVVPGDVLPNPGVDFGGPWGGAWRSVGFTQGGVNATMGQAMNAIQSDQQFPAVSQVRTGVEETIAVTFLENTLANIKDLLGRGTITTVAVGTVVTDPTVPIVPTGSTTGGTFPAGTYWLTYSVLDSRGGMTKTVAPVQATIASGVAGSISIAAVTPLPAGGTGVNYYCGLINGPSTGPFYLVGTNATGALIVITTPPVATAATPNPTNSTGRGKSDLTLDSSGPVRYVAWGFEGHAPPSDKGMPRRVLFPKVISTGPAAVGQALADVSKLAATVARVGGDEGNPIIEDVLSP